MINLETIVLQLEANGSRPGCSGYAGKLKSAILEHFGLLQENLRKESAQKLLHFTQNSATKIKGFYNSAKSVLRMIDRNKVRSAYSL